MFGGMKRSATAEILWRRTEPVRLAFPWDLQIAKPDVRALDQIAERPALSYHRVDTATS